MKRIKILKSGIQTHSTELDDTKSVEWISQGIAQNWWGKPERWVTELSGEDISKAIETRQVEREPGLFVTEYKLAAEYTIVEENIDAEIAAQVAAENAKKALKDKFKNLKKSDIDTVSEIGDALLDLLKVLELK